MGVELDGHSPFPADVTQVVDRNGATLIRTPQGWALKSGRVRGLVTVAGLGPYLVTAVDPELLPDAR